MRIIITIALLAFIGAGDRAQALDWRDDPAVAAIFEQAGVQGAFVLYDVDKNQFSGFNPERAAIRYRPASTFKIPNSLIGLEYGAVKDVDDPLPYDGRPRAYKAWEKEMGLREAIKVSNVPAYQELARRIGLEKMRVAVAELDYGNQDIGQVVDTFWLEGPLKISAVEQCLFLKRLALSELPMKDETQAAVREITVIDSGDFGTLHAKTGTTARGPESIGWWVGWIDGPGGVKVFALNVDLVDGRPGTDERIKLGRAALKAAGAL